ncbi:Cytochrome P450 [Dillenia turbinata]|uniref:Cytochrome P450 n=1 Tax=Dillenia turbinata TaxID=194707 RepID=A0AAN8ZE50_9MAGN
MSILFAYVLLLVPINLLLLSRKSQKIRSNFQAKSLWQTNGFHQWTSGKQVHILRRQYHPCQQSTNIPSEDLGSQNLLELMGKDHKRVREALLSFLKPDSLKQYVGKLEMEIREHLEKHWEGKQQVTTLTFNIICSILFGVKHGARRERFVELFDEAIKGMWSVPVTLPFTQYNRSIKASEKVRKMVKDLIREKRMELQQKENVMLAMVAGHETSATVLTFMIRALANNPEVYAALLYEQEQIAKSKRLGEFLTWEDLASMKYTWRVAMETMRLVPPVFAGFRTALKDMEYGGYLIPKGWQVFWAMSMTHMESSLFPEPTQFDPSRFENLTSVPPYSYIPFGGGPRICPGQEFAKLEILVATHYLVTRFTWKLWHRQFLQQGSYTKTNKRASC